MSFIINDKNWSPESAETHADNIIDTMNTVLQENSITDSDGNIVQLQKNFANAMYLLSLGLGNRIADMDNKLTQAINSFNVELSSDQQIENLLPIAALSRNSGSYSTLVLSVTASPDGACFIPKGTKAPYENVNFVVDNDTLVSAGATVLLDTTCDTLGPVAVLAGEVTAFESTITNLESVTNGTSSIPGVSAESINSIRKRLTKGEVIKYSLDGCKLALEELTGISYARVYFNYNLDTNMELTGGVVLAPRHAYIVVAGTSSKIADTYATYMSAPTQNSPIAAGKKTEVTLDIVASNQGDVVLPAGTSCSYNDLEYIMDSEEAVTIPSEGSASILFKCEQDGDNVIPAYSITALNGDIENIESVMQPTAAVPGYDDPAHVQDWESASGQTIPVYYDSAIEKKVFVKIVLKAEAETGNEVINQLKRDLITSSSEWGIGTGVTALLVSAPFADINYTDVAYCKVSEDGIVWQDIIDVDCNVIPEVVDGSITVEQLS